MNGRRRLIGLAALVLSASLLAASCGGGSSSSSGGGGSSESIRGQTITVLVPYKMPQSLLNKFTAETGVKVNYVVTGWDQTHNKLLVANEAGSYIADVAEFDWSFTGQFAGAGWVEPLNGLVDQKTLGDLQSTDKAFTSGGKTYAACYSNDFRMSMYNKKMFQKAGITSFPATFDELATDVQKLKASGVQYPLSIPMGATEGGVTPWYLLTLAMGGQLFDENNKPVFSDPNSAGYKALQWEVDAVKNGWVSPGAVSLDDTPASNKFTAGENAILLATGPGNMPTANDPSQSSIAGDAELGLVPGISGPGGSFGLPEGLSIPVTAKHKAAAAAFIEWWERPENAIAIYKTQGSLPCGQTSLKQLADSGQLQGGDVISAELPHVGPLFPGGAPIWYSQFSSDAQGLLNAAVKGDMSVSDALNQLSEKTAARSQ
ncbi:MAG TPA: extracellular solute-binding protein [Gaiellales bacterium]|nr:extracellular solute-binding protein [Gaiellales bacterium]